MHSYRNDNTGLVKKGLPVTILALTVMLGIGLAPRLARHEQVEAAVENNDVMTVTVVKDKPAEDTGLILPGSLQAVEEASLGARTTGYIRRRYVDIGSKVHAGQVLADIESPDVDAQLLQAHAQTAQSVASVQQAQSDDVKLEANEAQAVAQKDGSEAGVGHAKAAVLTNKAKLEETKKTLLQREADYRSAVATMDLAQREWKRYELLGKQGYVTQEDVDTRRSTLGTAQAALDSARQGVKAAEADVTAAVATVDTSIADLKTAEEQLVASEKNVDAAVAAVKSGQSNLVATQASADSYVANEKRYNVMQGFEHIIAPFNGVVTSRTVDTGDYVNPPTATTTTDASSTAPKNGLFGVARTDSMRITIYVPQSYMPNVKNGLEADVSVRELGDQTFSGIVWRVSGALDANSRTLQTEVHVPNSKGLLVPGMYADVHFKPIAGRTTTLHLPATALIIGADGTRVATVTPDNKIHIQPVTIGRDFGSEVEIKQGLTGSETVVDNPNDDLLEGTAVQPLTTAAKDEKKS